MDKDSEVIMGELTKKLSWEETLADILLQDPISNVETIHLDLLKEKYSASNDITALEFREIYCILQYQFYLQKKSDTKAIMKFILPKYKDRQMLLNVLQKRCVWVSFQYFFYAQLLETVNYNVKKNSVDIITLFRHVIIGLNTKEHAAFSVDIISAARDIIEEQLESLCAYLKKALEGNEVELLCYNTTTLLIPAIIKLFGAAGADVIYKNLCDDGCYAEVIKINMLKLTVLPTNWDNEYTTRCFNDYIKKEYLEQTNDNLIFEMLCKVKEKNKVFGDAQTDFIWKYLKRCNYSDLKYVKYIFGHVAVQCNSMLENGDEKALDIIPWLVDLRNDFINDIKTDDIEKVNIGARLYIEMYNVLYFSEYNTIYEISDALKFKPHESPVYRMLQHNNLWKFGEEADINDFLDLINVENAIPLIRLLEKLDKRSEFFTLFKATKIFFNVFCKVGLHIAEPTECFGKLCLGTLNRSEISVFTKLLINHYESTICETDYNQKPVYPCVVLISTFIKSIDNDIPEVLELENHLTRTILELCKNYSYKVENDSFDVKIAERNIAYSTELLLQIYKRTSGTCIKKISNALNFMEEVLNCNMRYTVTFIAQYYKEYICTISKHPDIVSYLKAYLHYKVLEIENITVKNSRLRRSTEQRVIIHSLCSGVSKSQRPEFITGALEMLMKVLSRVKNTESHVITINCITQLVEDSNGKEFVMAFYEICLVHCLNITISADFSVRNAIGLLFEALISKMFQSNDRMKNITSVVFFRAHPKLRRLLKIYIESPRNNGEIQSKIMFGRLLLNMNNENVKDTSVILDRCLQALVSPRTLESEFALELLVNFSPCDQIPNNFTKCVDFILKNGADYTSKLNLLYITTNFIANYSDYLRQFYLGHKLSELKGMIEILEILDSNEYFHELFHSKVIDSKFGRQSLNYKMHHSDFEFCCILLQILVYCKPKTDLMEAFIILTERFENCRPTNSLFINAGLTLLLQHGDESDSEHFEKFILYIATRGYQIKREVLDKTSIVLHKHFKKYLVLYAQVLNSLRIQISDYEQGIICSGFLLTNDKYAVAAFYALQNLVTQKQELLNVAIYILTVCNDANWNFVSEEIKKAFNNDFNISSYKSFIEGIFVPRHLHEFFTCPKLLMKYLAGFQYNFELIKSVIGDEQKDRLNILKSCFNHFVTTMIV